MSAFMTALVLVAYGTAAIVGVQMAVGSLARLAGSARATRPGQPLMRESLSFAGSLVLLLAGLFLVLQGAVVFLWAFS
ncbi:MAG: hypothetical protein HYY03_10210 [Chloroflexi bacterium]|nr:hypothetical protein [Chloroflexota bacterium]